MTISMYCLYVGFDYIYIDINTLGQGIKSFLASQVWFKPLLGLEPIAPIRPQLPVSQANHSATETCMYVRMYAYMYACVCVCLYICMYVCLCMYVYMYVYMCVIVNK